VLGQLLGPDLVSIARRALEQREEARLQRLRHAADELAEHRGDVREGLLVHGAILEARTTMFQTSHLGE
jgi:hypothetical protein